MTTELERLSKETSQQLSDLSDSISAPERPAEPSQDPSATTDNDPSSKKDRAQDLGRQSVQKEIEDLRAKLQKHKIKEEVAGDKNVARAKESVVRCLRENDRRPLDCWKEVEDFKREVGRLEKGFLGKVWD